MKIFVVALTIAAGYYFLLTSMTNLAMQQTQNLSNQYQMAIAQADAISSGSH